MKRREREILKASVSWTDKTLTVKEEKAFQAGAKWADKTMIKKACEWLESTLKSNLGYYEAADFADAFRKVMEE